MGKQLEQVDINVVDKSVRSATQAPCCKGLPNHAETSLSFRDGHLSISLWRITTMRWLSFWCPKGLTSLRSTRYGCSVIFCHNQPYVC